MNEVAGLQPGMQGRQIPGHYNIDVIDRPDLLHRAVYKIEGRVHQPLPVPAQVVVEEFLKHFRRRDQGYVPFPRGMKNCQASFRRGWSVPTKYMKTLASTKIMLCRSPGISSPRASS